MTNVIAVANKKGGVGKTTTSTQLASFFSGLCSHSDGTPFKVLAIDLDPQGNLTTALGIDKDDESLRKQTIAEIFIDEDVNLKDLIISVDENTHLIPANAKLEKANRIISTEENGSFILYHKLKPIIESGYYDRIIIDTAPAMSMVVENGLIASTEIVIPVEAEKWAFEGVSDFLEFIKSTNNKTQAHNLPDRNIIGIIFTKVDKRLKRHQVFVEEGRKDIEKAGFNCFKTEIHLCSTVGDSQTENKSVFEYKKNSRASVEYANFCKEIVEIEEKENNHAI